jgi:metallo-beta-lactamase class B
MNLSIISIFAPMVVAAAFAQTPAKPGDPYRAKAMQVAGADLKTYARRLCFGRDANDPASQVQIPPTRVFDNLIFLGYGRWNSWALTTSAGIILFDSLESDAEAQHYIIDGLTQLGLDPARIKYVVVMHGHGDHYGGAPLIHERFGARVLMSDTDWNLVANSIPPPGAHSRKPARDLVIRDGQTLRLGDTSVRLYLTPGHTAGTVSAIFPVFDHGQRHVVAYWGGTAIPQDAALLEQYVASIERFRVIARAAGVDVLVSNHPTNDLTLARLPQLAARKPGEPHPFVLGAAGYARSAQVLQDCVLAAQVDRTGVH